MTLKQRHKLSEEEKTHREVLNKIESIEDMTLYVVLGFGIFIVIWVIAAIFAIVYYT